MINFLVTAMLRMDQWERLSAAAYLKKRHELGVFKESFTGSGRNTPT